MNLKIVFPLCIVLLFFFIPTNAKAEAWVLWLKNELFIVEQGSIPKETRNYEILLAFPKFEQCLKAQEQAWTQKKSFYSNPQFAGIEKVDGRKPDLLFIYYKSNNAGKSMQTETFICLPSNIDPRK
jgi:hypothetical protein